MRAALVKRAAGRRVQRRRQLAAEHLLLLARGRIDARRAGQQRARVRVARRAEQRRLRRLLDHLAEVHHQHLVGDQLDHGEVVRDENVGDPGLVLQVHQQVQHLRLDRHVERRHGLVEHHDLGLQHQRAGNRHALPLAARKHVRIALGVLRAQAHARHHRADTLGALRLGQRGVDEQRLGQRVADFLARVEAGERVLEHHLHFSAQLPAQLLFQRGVCRLGSEVRDINAGELQTARGRCFDQRELPRQRALAATRFAHHGKRLAGLQRERDAVERARDGLGFQEAPADRVVLRQRLRVEHRQVAFHVAHRFDTAPLRCPSGKKHRACAPSAPINSGRSLWQRACT